MFSFLYSEKKKLRQNAANWLEVADRVYKFRRDQLTEAQTRKLLGAVDELRRRLKEPADAGRIKPAVESLEGVLQTTGGRLYPVSSMIENVEFFLVAAIVILGLRAYFVQPFKIPTNSMWPTYYGMTSQVFAAGEEPGGLRKVARLLGLGASNYSVTAPADGEVLIPVFGDLRPAYSEKEGRSFLIFPNTFHEYTFSVGGEMARVSVPAEFDYDRVVKQAFFPGRSGTLGAALQAAGARAQPLERSTFIVRDGARPLETQVYWIPVGKTVKRGEKLLSFDILTGDLLFVDRFTYNFFPPKVGSGFVFKTENIHGPQMENPPGVQIQQYYIKRLVGTPGDTLEVKPPVLWRNGRPIEGSAAFDKNARQEGLYPGYTNDGLLLSAGETITVPKNSYFAMGDNSPLSKDGRFWGFVPDKDVVGRPLFIYYPLTSRWGPAK